MTRNLQSLSIFVMAVLVWALCGGRSAAAQSILTLCNESEDRLSVAILYQYDLNYPLTESWKIYGWGDFPTGCQGIAQHPTRLDIFLAVRKRGPGEKRTIMHYPLDRVGEINTIRSGAVGAERFFCVVDDPFDRTLNTLDEHEQCPDGWQSQLFNLFVRVPSNTNYTLRLGGPSGGKD